MIKQDNTTDQKTITLASIGLSGLLKLALASALADEPKSEAAAPESALVALRRL